MALPEEKFEKGLKVCAEISIGKSVKAAGELCGVPEGTFFGWLTESKELAEEYTRVRQYRADARYESIDEVINDMRTGVIDATVARVQIDTIKWQCGKEKGSTYGDSTQLRHANADGGHLIIESAVRSLPNSDNEDNTPV